jgi:hypothetical protein
LLAGIQSAHDVFVSVPEVCETPPKIDLEHWRSEFIRKMKLVAQSNKLEYKEELERI